MAVATVNEASGVEQRLILLREPTLRKKATAQRLCGHAVLPARGQSIQRLSSTKICLANSFGSP